MTLKEQMNLVAKNIDQRGELITVGIMVNAPIQNN